MCYDKKVSLKRQEGMFKAMNNNRGAIVVGSVTIISVATILFTSTLQGLIAHKDSTQEETLAQVFERDIEVTARSSIDRTEEIKRIEISKDMDLTVRCGMTKEQFKELMQNLTCDTSGFFNENSDTIYEVCEKYEINEIFFCGLIAAESGWSISSRHREKCNYISMMSKGKLIRYDSPEEGLEAAAKLLHNRYLTEGGTYYEGKTLADVRKGFCPKVAKWTNLVYEQMEQIVASYEK